MIAFRSFGRTGEGVADVAAASGVAGAVTAGVTATAVGSATAGATVSEGGTSEVTGTAGLLVVIWFILQTGQVFGSDRSIED